MHNYTIVVEREFLYERKPVGAGVVAAQIQSEFPLGTLLSVLQNHKCRVIDEDADDSAADADTPTDEEAAADAAGEQAPTDETAAVAADTAADTPPAEAAEENDLLLAGIDERTVELLRDRGLTTVEEVHAYLDGGEQLSDLDGIGTRTAQKILQALGRD